MGLWQIVAIGTLVWASGALFGAGWLTWRAAPLRPVQDDRRFRTDHMNVSGTLIWWVVGIAVAWAMLVAVQEFIASDFWAVFRVAFWTAR